MAVDERTALALSLSAGQANDAPPGEQLVAEVISPDAQIRALCADRAYDTDALRAQLAAAPAPKQAVIPPRANRRVPYAYDQERYRQPNRVERLVGRLKAVPGRGHALRQARRHVRGLGRAVLGGHCPEII